MSSFFSMQDVAKKSGLPETTVMQVIYNVKDVEKEIKL